MKRLKRIYGWTEQNEASFGIDVIDVPEEVDILPEHIDKETNEILCIRGLPEGQWYPKFLQAKKALILHWKRQQTVAKQALAKVRKTKLVAGVPVWG